MRVARWTYKISNLLNMKHKKDVTRAALLHDFYINDDLVSENGASKLGEHPTVALENSKKYFIEQIFCVFFIIVVMFNYWFFSFNNNWFFFHYFSTISF